MTRASVWCPLACLLVLTSLVACDDGEGGGQPLRDASPNQQDGQIPDSGPHDARPTDSTLLDSSPPDFALDAAPLDAAPLDAAPLDAAPLDAAPLDAAPLDAAPLDAAPPDATPDVALPDAAEPRCGNGTLEDGEVCDDGNTEPGDGCDELCQPEPLCGNGQVEAGETCDEGDLFPGDGCDERCQTEAICGNGELEEGEQCDDGDLLFGDGCDEYCEWEPVCGNGLTEWGESCDDGGLEPGDGCDNRCRAEPFCGDGAREGTEECDDGDRTPGDGCDATCLREPSPLGALPHYGRVLLGVPDRFVLTIAAPGNVTISTGTPTCRGDTTLVLRAVDGRVLAWDDEAAGNGCAALSLAMASGDYWLEVHSESLAADYILTVSTELCGNRQIDPGEGCDEGDNISGDGCDAHCRLEGRCGNGRVEPGETCDDGNQNSNDGCSSDCDSEAYCGDNIVQPPEECDQALSCNRCRWNSQEISIPSEVHSNEIVDILSRYSFTLNSSSLLRIEFDDSSECRYDLIVIIRDINQQEVYRSNIGECVDQSVPLSAGRYELDITSTGSFQLELSQVPLAREDDPCDADEIIAICEAGTYCSDGLCTRPRCGNGEVEPTEDCDDRNQAPGDGCLDCRFEPGCGDLIIGPGETCDEPSPACVQCQAVAVNASQGGVFTGHFKQGGRGRFAIDRETPTRLTAILTADEAGCPMEPRFQVLGPTNQPLTLSPHALGCGGVTVDLPPGRSVLDIWSAEGDAVPEYLLRLTIQPLRELGEPCQVNRDACLGGGCDGTTCVFALCGNRITEPGEACDDGNQLQRDGCDECQAEPPCGDGIRQGSEECDDGNYRNRDGCSQQCLAETRPLEAGLYALGLPHGGRLRYSLTLTEPKDIKLALGLGDGRCPGALALTLSGPVVQELVGTGLSCPRLEQRLPAGAYLVEITTVDGPVASFVLSAQINALPRCGDGLRGPGEACDDGNTRARDGCSETCQEEPRCGDGRLQATETCEDGNTTSGDGCDLDCQREPPRCGNGRLEPALEECDDGSDLDGDGCNSQCLVEPLVLTPSIPRVGHIPAAGLDRFTFTLARPQTIRLSIIADGEICPNNIVLWLKDANSALISAFDGGTNCTQGELLLTPGEYEVLAFERHGAAIDRYRLVLEFFARCGNGAVEGDEVCDDGNIQSNDGCSPLCAWECGDGRVSGLESCDDGGRLSGDGCSATCEDEVINVGQGGTFLGQLESSESDFYRLTSLGEALLRVETSDGQGGCPGDTFIILYQIKDGTEPIQLTFADDGGIGSCAAFTYPVAAGSYLIEIIGGLTADELPSYIVSIALGGECGNRVIEPGEACDDGNMAAGDGCDPTCQEEPLSSSVDINAGGVFQVDPIAQGQLAAFRFSIDRPAKLFAITGNTEGNCPNGLDTVMGLYKVQLDQSLLEIDENDDLGDNILCSLLQKDLDAGDYRLIITGFQGDAVPQFHLTIRYEHTCGNGIHEISEQCDDSNTTNSDGCDSNCLLDALDISGGGDFPGELLDGQYSRYRFTLIRQADAKIFTSDGQDGCPGDTILSLHVLDARADRAQSFVNDDVDAPNNLCSLLEGTLPAGTYEVEVRGFNYDPVPPFFLTLELTGTCGNGIWEETEVCDDGNARNGDGCSSTCESEIINITGGGIFQGSFGVGEADIFAFDLPQSALATFETSGPAGIGCSGDTTLELYRINGVQPVQVGVDEESGIPPCASLDVSLDAGTYLLRVSGDAALDSYEMAVSFGSSCGDGEIQVTEVCDDENNLNGDGCSSNCHAEGGELSGGGEFLGGFSAESAAYYTLTLLEETELLLLVDDGQGACPTDVDPRLWLLQEDERGWWAPFTDDDDSGAGLCPAIQRTLPSGRYVVRVDGFNGSAVPAFILSVYR